MEFTPEIVLGADVDRRYQRLTMHAPRSPKINATGQNRAQLTTW
jgi:hypothetical protein